MSHSNKLNIIIIFALLYLSLIIGFLFGENSSGGAVSDYPNGEFNLSSGRILACSPRLEEELKMELSKVTPLNKQFYT